jgi:reverse gyrase
MEFCCPNCHSPIYSRKLKICGVCEQSLPKELLLTNEQTAFLKKQLDLEEKRGKEFNPNIVHGAGDGSSGMI